MPLVDIQLINRKIKLIDANLVLLKKYGGIPFVEYQKNIETKLIVERLLEIITSQIIDINYHILKEEYETIPTDYYNSFIEMGGNKIVTEDLAIEIAKSTGLRNALAYSYEKINDELVFNSIKTALTQFPLYLSKIVKFLN